MPNSSTGLREIRRFWDLIYGSDANLMAQLPPSVRLSLSTRNSATLKHYSKGDHVLPLPCTEEDWARRGGCKCGGCSFGLSRRQRIVMSCFPLKLIWCLGGLGQLQTTRIISGFRIDKLALPSTIQHAALRLLGKACLGIPVYRTRCETGAVVA
jgi:hypothetical protein